MNHQDIRNQFDKYFSKQNHTLVSSSSLIPKSDPSILFTNAGMNQFKDYFLGIKTSTSPCIYSIQKCLRAGGKHNDLEQVGHSVYHHTFFEMLGFFCFGSYGKAQAIQYAIHFLTKELNLSKDNLWVSVFKNDKESAEIWNTKQHIPKNKIFLLDEKHNFWRMGEVGPCGPCTEIYYYNGVKKNPTINDMLEIWNLVFMEFNEDSTGKLTPLPQLCIDTGMGLERLTTILQNKKDNYQTDLFLPIINSITLSLDTLSDSTPAELSQQQIACKVIADHCRAISFLICDGVLPGSEGASYVLRRILRRALFYSQKLKSSQNLLSVASTSLCEIMKDIYPELNKNQLLIHSTIQKEATLFTENLSRGKHILLQKMQNLPNKIIPNSTVWNLYSTYGFPPDLTKLIVQEKKFMIQDLTLEQLKKQNNKTSVKQKQNWKWTSLKHMLPKIAQQCKVTNIKFTGYNFDIEQAQIILFPNIKNSELYFVSNLKKSDISYIVTDKTCFYPEGGGAISDRGIIQTQTGKAQVLDCQKAGDFIFHKVQILEGEIILNQNCTLTIDKNHRRLTATSHSATHLLHQALKSILGPTVQQMGSLVTAGELRFDFNYSQILTPDQLISIQDTVNNYIQSQNQVSIFSCSYKEAIQKGALSLPGETYSQQVRVIKIGNSQELCGGIHVKNSSEIGDFKIISETGVQSGVRRITAYTNDKLQNWYSGLEKQNKVLRTYLGLSVSLIAESSNPFIHYLQVQETEIKNLKQQMRFYLLQIDSKKNSPTLKTNTNKQKTIPQNKKNIESKFLVQQNEELRKYLNLSLPKDINAETENIFIPFMQKKQNEVKLLQTQLHHLMSSFCVKPVIQKAKTFKYKNINGVLLSIFLPITDRKFLAEIADQFKLQISAPAGVVVIVGDSATDNNTQSQFPIIVSITNKFSTDISANTLLKNTIFPILKGKGGGQARFAQGTITNKDLFPKLENILLKTLNQSS